jgi:predicted aspartyl protease
MEKFLSGDINEDLEPKLDNIFVAGKKAPVQLDVILDTGFNGELSLPVELKERYKLEFVSVKPYELANGEIVEADVYLAELIVNDEILVVETTLTGSKIALIGMELIRNKIAVFNMKDNTVKVSNYESSFHI